MIVYLSFSGGRKIRVLGSSLEFVDAVSIQTSPEEVMLSSDNKVGNTQIVLGVLSVLGVLTFNTKDKRHGS